MKLAVSNIGWAAQHDLTIAPALLDAGVDALEVAPGRVFENVPDATIEDAREVNTHWAAQNLPIVSMQALLFGQPDLRLFGTSEQRRHFEDYLRHVISLAGALGCGPLVFGSPGNRSRGDLEAGEAFQAAIPSFRRIGEIAEATGTCFCIEANATGYGCDFLTRLDEAARMVRDVDHRGVGLVLDTGNMMMAGDDPERIGSYTPLIRHVHCSAPQLAPIGPYADYFRTILHQLNKAGYAGFITLEMRSGETLEPLIDSLRSLRSLIDEVTG